MVKANPIHVLILGLRNSKFQKSRFALDWLGFFVLVSLLFESIGSLFLQPDLHKKIGPYRGLFAFYFFC